MEQEEMGKVGGENTVQTAKMMDFVDFLPKIQYRLQLAALDRDGDKGEKENQSGVGKRMPSHTPREMTVYSQEHKEGQEERKKRRGKKKSTWIHSLPLDPTDFS